MVNERPIIFGEVLFDHFPDGSRILGGAPFNVAWHLQAFKANPLLISRIGDDPEGLIVEKTMSQWGMDLSGLQSDSNFPTGHVVVEFQEGNPSYRIPPNQAWDMLEWDPKLKLASGLIYHGSLALRFENNKAVFKQISSQFKVPVFLDVNLRDPWWDSDSLDIMVNEAEWVKLNEHELKEMESKGSSLEQRAKNLLDLQQLSNLIVTAGEKGAFAFCKERSTISVCPELVTQIKDTVGAGDAFSAICILGALHHWPMDLTLTRAQDFAARIIQQRGATAADRDLYHHFIKCWKI